MTIFRPSRISPAGWPSRVSALIAAEIGADGVLLGIALEKHVRERLAGWVEPDLKLT